MTRCWQVDRRTVLKGLGATFALPFLEAMVPPAGAAAQEAAKPPLRFGIWYYPQGSLPEHWIPSEVGPMTRLPSVLRPFERLLPKTTVVSNLTNSCYYEGRFSRGGHQHEMHVFSCAKNIRDQGVRLSSVSIDQFIAGKIGQETPVKSLTMVDSGGRSFWHDSTTPIHGEMSPRLVFDRLFRRQGDGSWPSDLSILDVVREQTASLKNRVGRQDQRQLDQYLESVREAEKNLQIVERRQKEIEVDHSRKVQDLRIDGLPETPRYDFDHQDAQQVQKYLRLMSDLLVLGFQTDTTRVGSLNLWPFGEFPDVVSVGNDFSHHALAHAGAMYDAKRGDPISREAFREITVWFNQNCAYLAQRLDSILEPNGTLLDNSLILNISDLAVGGDHSVENIPTVLLGSGGGLFKTGRHVVAEKFTPIANLYVELLNRMGLPTVEFGDSHIHPQRKHDGRLPELG
ncbi:MAG TPA: DUF1552 domain-containing protein [Planctomycetota bacterium]|nr:DUF1552 domain-containing protein [Planctomycetota bacterium]